ncbi:MAG: S9 family peptidase [Solobacterium sp.]|nr:S9 family peptidase [Solobacterium sp.]
MKKVEIEDFARIRKLSDPVISPSGRKLAVAVTEGDVDKNTYKSDIWVYDEAHLPAFFRLTASENGKAPCFLDENTILFPGDRMNAHPAKDGIVYTVYNRISLDGGEASEYMVLPFAASGLFPLSDETFLVQGSVNLNLPDLAGMTDEEKKDALAALEEEKDYSVFDELPFWFNGRGVINKLRTGLFLADRSAGTQEKLTDTYFDLHGFSVNQEKTKVIYWGNEFETVDPQKSRMYIRDLTDGSVAEVKLENRYNVSGAVFSGSEIVFLGSTGETYGTSENPKFYLCHTDGSFELLADPDPSLGGVGSDIAGGGSVLFGKDGIFFVQTVGYHSVFRKMDMNGNIETLIDEISIVSCAAGTDPIYFLGMEKDRPQEVYMKKNGIVTKISCFNEEYVSEHEIAETEHFTFTDADGVEIDGWVLYPADFDTKKKYPAILDVHGGPQTAYGEGFFHEMQYWAAMGYIVFFCNPRGSSGKGGSFADIYGDNYGVRDYNDLMEFTDQVLARVPQADPERIAMTGGSYGGFMANWMIGHTDRFAAAASQRSISNYISKCLTTDIGYYHNLSAIQADPWNSPEKMWAHSPLAYADKAKTPTLFIQSDEDYRCWMADAIQMLQALLMHGVPARMCLFHGENHELSRSGKPKHRIRRLKEITEWFDRYVKNKE